jgi:predicted nucleotidyltransferase
VSARLANVLADVASALRNQGVEFALVGGLAVSVRSEPRFTRDIDLAVAVSDDDAAQAVVAALAPRFEPVALLEHDSLNRLAAVRLAAAGHATTGIVVALLFASSGVEAELAMRAEPMEVFAGVTVPVARTGGLLALKVLARAPNRPMDTADLHALLAVAAPDDLAETEGLLDLIMERGSNRGRDLPAEWRQLTGRR